MRWSFQPVMISLALWGIACAGPRPAGTAPGKQLASETRGTHGKRPAEVPAEAASKKPAPAAVPGTNPGSPGPKVVYDVDKDCENQARMIQRCFTTGYEEMTALQRSEELRTRAEECTEKYRHQDGQTLSGTDAEDVLCRWSAKDCNAWAKCMKMGEEDAGEDQ